MEHYIVLKLYELTKDHSSLKHTEIFKIFPPDPQYRLEEDN